MDNTPNLQLPYLMAAQAQKHVTHNEAIRALDALVQLAVLDMNLSSPPPAPANGDRYIVGPSASDGWAGKDTQIAAWQDNAWMFYPPQAGWLCWVADEDKLYRWDGAAWLEVTSDTSEIQDAQHVGVNATADDMNRLAVSSPASLLTHEGGGHQLKINKNAAADTASVLFQTNWSGRAEFGLSGDDDWHVKVSPDGASWYEALVADKDTGAVYLPQGATLATVNGGPLAGFRNKIINGDFQIAQRAESQSGGGTNSVDLWFLNTSGSSNCSLTRQLFTPGQTDVDGAPTYYLRMETFVDEDNVGMFYPIESVYTLQNLPVTLSFWARGNASGNLNFKLYQKFGTGGSAQTVVVTTTSLSSTWSRIVLHFTLPSLAGKTIGTGHNVMLEFSNPVRETWFMEMADFQLEQGNIATPFERRPPGLELELCRRYFRRYATAQNVNDLAYSMYGTPTQSGAGPYDYDAGIM